jgi:hypothetical protein
MGILAEAAKLAHEKQAAERHASRRRVSTWGEFVAAIEAHGVTDGTELRSIADMAFPCVVRVTHEDINAPFGIDIGERH